MVGSITRLVRLLDSAMLGQDEQGMEEAPGVVFVEMRYAKGGGACREVRKARLCDGWGCTSRQSEEEAGFEMAVLQKKIGVFSR